MRYSYLVFLFLLIFTANITLASTTDGTISDTNAYAYGENVGWMDFGSITGAVRVTDTALSGYAYGENIGWISLNCSNTDTCATVDYKVTNDAEGNLAGYAWGENTGWIHFAPTSNPVTIDSSGIFHGQAYGENIGWITFNCTDTSSCGDVNYTITTDWRPASSRVVASSSSGGSSGSRRSVKQVTIPTSNPTSTTSQSDRLELLKSTLTSLGFDITPELEKILELVANSSLSPTTNNFTKDLDLDTDDPQVKLLQIFLNANGFPVSIAGVGSLGQETTYFGALTQSALARFQTAKGILPSVGYFGPLTRAFISANY